MTLNLLYVKHGPLRHLCVYIAYSVLPRWHRSTIGIGIKLDTLDAIIISVAGLQAIGESFIENNTTKTG